MYSHKYVLIIHTYSCKYVLIKVKPSLQASIAQELEGTGYSIGVWYLCQINPDVYLDMTFMFLLYEMTKVFIEVIHIRTNTHKYRNMYSCEYVLKI